MAYEAVDLFNGQLFSGAAIHSQFSERLSALLGFRAGWRLRFICGLGFCLERV